MFLILSFELVNAKHKLICSILNIKLGFKICFRLWPLIILTVWFEIWHSFRSITSIKKVTICDLFSNDNYRGVLNILTENR